MNKRKVGTVYETMAAEYLHNLGYRIVERNFRCRMGEIDIIAEDKDYLCFIEVKFRSGTGCGSPLEAITRKKQHRIIRVAQYYMAGHGYTLDTLCRFDVVAIQKNEITLLRDAFCSQGE